ncbi:BEN domain-containing protein 7 isoform X3 [Moschus berezovskii]|uniref:BEN domain-containing protein 7 isoform X3 n=1 Tax=Moschus berezovskii TaxID=68408 RepID=UPI0024442A07|nr:BEN domain-containing protein 7 isoform X3 [Moschus berezovskii]
MAAAALRQQVAPGSRRRRLLPAPLLPRGRSAPRPGSHPAAAAALGPPAASPGPRSPPPPPRPELHPGRPAASAQGAGSPGPPSPPPTRSPTESSAPAASRPAAGDEPGSGGELSGGQEGATSPGRAPPARPRRPQPPGGLEWFFPCLCLPPADPRDGPRSPRSRCRVTRASAVAASAAAPSARPPPAAAPALPARRTMEFSERKRSRKSQSFKLVNRDYHHEVYKISDFSSDVNGEAKETQPIFLGDESMEIKKQITGMRRLLNDSAGRIYQRVGKEGEKLKEEPQDLDAIWPQRLNSAEVPPSLHPSSRGTWNELPPQSGQFSGQYGTRSRTFQSQPHTAGSSNGELPAVNSSTGSNCCTCNCQSTLQAILHELKTMRKLMQIQAVGTQNRQQPPISLICSQRTAVSRKRNKKKKVPPKTVEPLTVKQKPSTLEAEKKAAGAPENSSLPAAEHPSPGENHILGFGIVLESPASDPEVQLAEGFDVFMPKSQLDSILSNYTRSGSLLFRKLVCAFFDDKTLANSLPNGKRKRGLNDNRKGLDQNIVGAIKVFTEKYCTANHVDKLPGPRDWVQILQDQIKLARRRLKRGSAEAADGDERLDSVSLTPTDGGREMFQMRKLNPGW